MRCQFSPAHGLALPTQFTSSIEQRTVLGDEFTISHAITSTDSVSQKTEPSIPGLLFATLPRVPLNLD